MNILVTGGAGYIGSFMAKRLLEKGDMVTVLDSLERGHKEAIDSKANFVQGNVLDTNFLDGVFSNNKFDAIIHFAGYISMGESMENPYLYFQNNTYGSLNLIEKAMDKGVKNIVFSSTAGVYGNPVKIPIDEDHQKVPENPYGESKLMVEKILSWFAKTKGLSFAALRYFNAAGAALDGSLGERHEPESHIIPNIMSALLNKKPFKLFGEDYNTPDKTCVRDYIHVLDLVESHLLTIDRLIKKPGSYFYNVGTGKGYSNKEVVEMVRNVTGEDFEVKIVGRRPGDADTLIADPTKIKMELGFEPKYSDLKTIIETDWKWHKKKHQDA
ncbi:MAG: UDP-glucose 4-epimerase GalE [Candidatus Levybacteria bacterium RBG_16_35_11]|nr:MAG: UDP-glucose 4-epimerase GalE [Candidatus Levybacteria bacterium RBG_16_35_11]